MKMKTLKTMLVSAMLFTAALGCGFASAAQAKAVNALAETTVEQTAEAVEKIVLPAPPVIDTVYATLEETGIDFESVKW